jgi:hypothetical protein
MTRRWKLGTAGAGLKKKEANRSCRCRRDAESPALTRDSGSGLLIDRQLAHRRSGTFASLLETAFGIMLPLTSA